MSELWPADNPDYWRERAERAESKLAAYERVVEAAKAWRDGRGPKQDGSLVDKLEAAIDALTGKDAGKDAGK